MRDEAAMKEFKKLLKRAQREADKAAMKSKIRVISKESFSISIK